MTLVLLVHHDRLVSSFSAVGWRTRFRKPISNVPVVGSDGLDTSGRPAVTMAVVA